MKTLKPLSIETTVFNALVELDVPTGVASQAAILMADMQLPHLPASSKLPDLIEAFVELYELEGEDALKVLNWGGKSS